MDRRETTRRIRAAIAAFVEGHRAEILEIILDQIDHEKSIWTIEVFTKANGEKLCAKLQDEIDYLNERAVPVGER